MQIVEQRAAQPARSAGGRRAIAPGAISFRWASSYLSTIEYEVFARGLADEPFHYRVSLRHCESEYERKVYNGTPEDYRRQVVTSLGLLCKVAEPTCAVPEYVVEAFNAWRLEQHRAAVAEILANPGRYGELTKDDRLLMPPEPVRGGRFDKDLGQWVAVSF